MVQNWYLHHTFFTQVPVIAKVRVMVFNATFNSVIGGGNRSTRRKPQIYRKLLTNYITLIA